jgi:hypothetical protein
MSLANLLPVQVGLKTMRKTKYSVGLKYKQSTTWVNHIHRNKLRDRNNFINVEVIYPKEKSAKRTGPHLAFRQVECSASSAPGENVGLALGIIVVTCNLTCLPISPLTRY